MKIRSIRFIREIRVGFEREPGVRQNLTANGPNCPNTANNSYKNSFRSFYS